MQNKGSGQYLAGMWRDDIAESILWLPRPAYSIVPADNTISTYRRRASPYRAPTWSWMSLETHQDGKNMPKCVEVPDWYENHSWKLIEVYAELIDAYCDPSGLDPTGAVKAGYILLKTKCVEVLFTWESRRSSVTHGGFDLNVHWDIDLEFGVEQSLVCVLVGKAVSGHCRGLVLQSSKSATGAYERVGLLNNTSNLGYSAGTGLQRDLFVDARTSLVRIV
jgi:hypothetical protein